ncbi:MAG: ribbon-helix-helix protein, CopG family [Candidatus Omnitrophica bacterium]|nr:ribbon-helix-helix protein, CopG family [Candidatus Omnitrophota bacterium]MBU4473037.1 ribbon-helix-helix protein, CopG family [Candidatus Omnitrophota bacterium]
MRHSLSISLPEGMYKQLKTECKKENANGSEVVRQALRVYFFRRDFARARQKAMIEAEKRGISLTEEEVFKKIS